LVAHDDMPSGASAVLSEVTNGVSVEMSDGTGQRAPEAFVLPEFFKQISMPRRRQEVAGQ
jgi:hypothetical protein